jgi:ferrous iron transport protein A
MMIEKPLGVLAIGAEARIVKICGGRRMVRRLSEMGFTPGTEVKIIHNHNPYVGPVLIEIKDSRIALGRGVSMKIMVEEVE